MRLIATMPARNEDWILGLSARAVLRWCDHLVALDHASTDRTPEILAEVARENPDRVTILEDPDPGGKEMAHRQALLETARGLGATHIAITDADEVLSGNLLPVIRSWFDSLPRAAPLQVKMPCMWRAYNRYRKDVSIWSRAFVTVGFKDRPNLRWQQEADGYDFHHREPYHAEPVKRVHHESGGLMHLQWVYWRRFLAKHALYKMLETVRWPGRRTPAQIESLYNLAPNESGLHLECAPAAWWAPYSDLLPHLKLDGEPWQEAECRRLMTLYGSETFRGLDLFGVVEAVHA
jgi:glycosyltransferase involved in cell wall biosynthesis